MAYRSKAPVRIDFAGGTTDIPAVARRHGGAVLSAALSRYAYCTAHPRQDDAVEIRAEELHTSLTASSRADLVYDGTLDLLKAAVHEVELDCGVRIWVRCEAPPGSGVGSSASVTVAVLGALTGLRASRTGEPQRSQRDLAEAAYDLDGKLGIVGGSQDQYAAALGGLNFMEFGPDEVTVTPVAVAPWLRLELQKQLVVCYSGEARFSSEANARMIDAYERAEPDVVRAMERVKEVACRLRVVFEQGQVDEIGPLLDEETEARLQLSPEAMTPKMAALSEAAREAGALGTKICGAGGGGSLLFLSAPDRESAVCRALVGLGGQILDFTFDDAGAQVWESPV